MERFAQAQKMMKKLAAGKMSGVPGGMQMPGMAAAGGGNRKKNKKNNKKKGSRSGQPYEARTAGGAGAAGGESPSGRCLWAADAAAGA